MTKLETTIAKLKGTTEVGQAGLCRVKLLETIVVNSKAYLGEGQNLSPEFLQNFTLMFGEETVQDDIYVMHCLEELLQKLETKGII